MKNTTLYVPTVLRIVIAAALFVLSYYEFVPRFGFSNVALAYLVWLVAATFVRGEIVL